MNPFDCLYFNPVAQPILVSGIINLFLFFSLIRKNKNLGEGYLAFMMLAASLYSFFYYLELSTSHLECMYLFIRLEYLGATGLAPFLLLFALKYTGQTDLISRPFIGMLFIIPAFVLVMALSNDFHFMYYSSFKREFNGSYYYFDFKTGWVYWLHQTFSMAGTLVSTFLLFRMLLLSKTIYRKQILVMLLGALTVWGVYLSYLFDFVPYGLDPIPFAFAISGIIMYIGLIYFRLFEISPIAFKALFDNLPNGVMVIDIHHFLVEMNTKASSLLGVENTFVGSLAKSAFADYAEIVALFENQERSQKIQLKRDRSETLLWLEVSSSPLTNSDQQLLGQLLIIRDITNEKSRSDELKKRQRILGAVANASDVLLKNRSVLEASNTIFSEIGRAVEANRVRIYQNEFSELNELDSSNLKAIWASSTEFKNVESSSEILFTPRAKMLLEKGHSYLANTKSAENPDLISLLEREQICSSLCLPLKIKDKFWGYIQLDNCTNNREWDDNEFSILVAFSKTLSTSIERNILLEELEESVELAESANKIKSDFLTNMSHEIRTPLNGIIGFSDLLRNSTIGPENRGYADTIYNSASSLLEVVSEILDFSKIEAGKIDVLPESFELIPFLERVLSMVEFQATQKKLQLKLITAPNLPRYFVSDMLRLRQILLNLLGNALKFTSEGFVELNVCVLHFHEQSATVRFSVSDSGIGVSEEMQQSIFEPFTQADISTSRKFGGSGLGLTISNRLLEMMNSKMQLKSSPNQGSVFSFDLDTPVNPELTPHRVTESFDSEVKKVQTYNEEIVFLIVEDNPVNTFLTKTILRKNYPFSTIHEAENGNEALEKLSSISPNIILMDVQMPVMNGYDTTKNIRNIDAFTKVPIVAITAGTISGERERCLDAGMNDYMRKPLVEKELVEMVEKWIGAKTHIELKKSLENSIPSIPKNEHFDFETILRNYNRDMLLFRQIMPISLQSVRQSISEIITHIENDDIDALKFTAHKLKGTSLNACFTKISELAIAVQGAQDCKSSHVQTLANDLQTNFELLVAIVEPLLSREEHNL